MQSPQQDATPVAVPPPGKLALAEFIGQFGDSLLDAVRAQCAPYYDGTPNALREQRMDALLRSPFPAQRDVVQSVLHLLFDRNRPAAIINAEMGTGKTIMAIAAAALAHAEGSRRTLVIAPPHLVYKWRREIKETVPGARVWILNGPDTLRKLLSLRAMREQPTVPEFFILGRVRMRMGFHWRAAYSVRSTVWTDELGARHVERYASCAHCGAYVMRAAEDGADMPMSAHQAAIALAEDRRKCGGCASPLWSLTRRGKPQRSRRDLVLDGLIQMPTIGPKTAEQLLATFGENLLGSMLEDNVFEFVNLMDADGELVFSDRQARRIERALATTEVAFGQGDYQATEFIKRYLPQGYFGLLVVDEGHEYKNEGSAQGQAMGVLARKCSRTLLLTGTLMGGYADDLFHLLWRLHPAAMIEDGFKVNARGRLGTASMAFMREHGVLKDIYKSGPSTSHRTAKGRSTSHRTARGPGFGPKGIIRYVLPITVFLKLKQIGGNVLPSYEESFEAIDMSEVQAEAYRKLSAVLSAELRTALARGDTSLLGVVINVLLAWPDCAFRDELVRHPRSREQLAYQRAVFDDAPSPKEAALIERCAREKSLGRKVLVYTTYTGTRDTTSRLRVQLAARGFKVAVLRASVSAAKREDWVADQVERGIDVLITNPELVKTGLDLLDFPTIAFMQSGYNVYTLQQAARRSWRIGQKQGVKVVFFGYGGSAQMQCLELMAKKIAVSQSTSGDMPDSGLDVLNQSGDSVEVALAKQLVAA